MLIIIVFTQVDLPDIVRVNEKECIADWKIRQKMRLNYPGACSLEFQNIMQILIDKLFNWDAKKQQARGPGLFGTVLAFAPADEEQGRKTLHRHIQVWVKEVDNNLRKQLFQEDEVLKRKA